MGRKKSNVVKFAFKEGVDFSNMAVLPWDKVKSTQQNQAIGMFPSKNITGKYFEDFAYRIDDKGNIVGREEVQNHELPQSPWI